jgi:hypothetical protein
MLRHMCLSLKHKGMISFYILLHVNSASIASVPFDGFIQLYVRKTVQSIYRWILYMIKTKTLLIQTHTAFIQKCPFRQTSVPEVNRNCKRWLFLFLNIVCMFHVVPCRYFWTPVKLRTKCRYTCIISQKTLNLTWIKRQRTENIDLLSVFPLNSHECVLTRSYILSQTHENSIVVPTLSIWTVAILP